MQLLTHGSVTSLVEVWIETYYLDSSVKADEVTSLVEVWIETRNPSPGGMRIRSLPLWKCGLKPMRPAQTSRDEKVTSLVEVWIETAKKGS